LLDVCSYSSIKSILDTKLETQPVPEPPSVTAGLVTHDNLRGAAYYQSLNPNPQESPHVA